MPLRSAIRQPFAITARRVLSGLQALATVARARLDPRLRPLIPAIRQLAASLPTRHDAQPLPDFLAGLTPPDADLKAVNPDRLRDLVDALARIDRRHPFGLCLRRSLLRYHFLRRAGVPLGITFGVRIRKEHEPPGIAGHAWNTLDDQPWCEREEDYRGFAVLYVWPATRVSLDEAEKLHHQLQL